MEKDTEKRNKDLKKTDRQRGKMCEVRQSARACGRVCVRERKRQVSGSKSWPGKACWVLSKSRIQ